MPATLRDLMRSSRFALSAAHDVDDIVLDRPLPWAHSSDLADPTPWLDKGGLLLTDGIQFDGPDSVPAGDYVARLRSHDVLALGFATGIIHEAVPESLVGAAASAGLPLFLVPRHTPFMAIIRFVSDAVAADAREVLEASLQAQRSVARAALRPDGLSEILRELERNLDCWVTLFDASGVALPAGTRRRAPAHLVGELRGAVERMLGRGRTAAERLILDSSEGDPSTVTLQTLGTRGELRGVLAVGTGAGTGIGTVDRARSDLVDAVIALASIALEQSRTLDDARRRLRTGVLELLIAGMTDVARRTVGRMWGDLPSDPIRVASIASPSNGDGGSLPLLSSLELLSGDRKEELFYAETDSGIIAVTAAEARDELMSVSERTRSRVGFSAPSTWAALSSAMREADTALAHAVEQGRSSTDFDALARDGLLGHLERTHAHDVARRMLAPLDHPAAPPHLRSTLEVWLEHNGAWDPAARSLGIHRHTLRARVDAASALLALDLDTFRARAEVWSALQLTTVATPTR